MSKETKATVEFEITLKYTTTVETYPQDEDAYDLDKEIKLQKEYLETQREDLYAALDDSELVKVEIKNIIRVYPKEGE